MKEILEFIFEIIMKTRALKILITLFLFLIICNPGNSIDSLRYYFSVNYSVDLSDTYGGGNLLTGEIGIAKSWYGINLSFGQFQSHSKFIYQIVVEGIDKKINIPFDELTIMQMGSISLKLSPIQNKIIETDLAFGISYALSKNSRFNSVDYSYSLLNEKFDYLYKDYKLVMTHHFGFQFGFDIRFFIKPRMALQLNSRIQDLSEGGTFFFVGTGLCFKL